MLLAVMQLLIRIVVLMRTQIHGPHNSYIRAALIVFGCCEYNLKVALQ